MGGEVLTEIDHMNRVICGVNAGSPGYYVDEMVLPPDRWGKLKDEMANAPWPSYVTKKGRGLLFYRADEPREHFIFMGGIVLKGSGRALKKVKKRPTEVEVT